MAKNIEETSPFVYVLEIPAVWKKKNLPFGSSDGAKNIYTHHRLIDVENRASVYTDHILEWFFQLPASAKDMFMYISHRLGYETDIIELKEDVYCQATGVSRATFHNAKTALTNRLIAPRKSRKNTYWVNPSYLFKGERTKIFPNNTKELNAGPDVEED